MRLKRRQDWHEGHHVTFL